MSVITLQHTVSSNDTLAQAPFPEPPTEREKLTETESDRNVATLGRSRAAFGLQLQVEFNSRWQRQNINHTSILVLRRRIAAVEGDRVRGARRTGHGDEVGGGSSGGSERKRRVCEDASCSYQPLRYK